MQRRMFLGGMTAASLGVLLENSLPAPARAQNSGKTGVSLPGRGSFESSIIEVSGNTIFVRRYGKGRPFCWFTASHARA